jgi:uncharacterized protein (TIGR00369 family)
VRLLLIGNNFLPPCPPPKQAPLRSIPESYNLGKIKCSFLPERPGWLGTFSYDITRSLATDKEMVIRMNDKRLQNYLIWYFSTSGIKKTFGMDLSFSDQGQAVFTQPYNPGLDHARGAVHGGVIATLLDNAGWFSAATLYGRWVNTVELGIHLLEPVSKEVLIATGEVIRKGGRLAVARSEVRTQDGRLIAIGTGTFAASSIEINPDDGEQIR